MDMESEPEALRNAAVSLSVLIVNHDFMTRWRAAYYLRERGYLIIEAAGVADAISLLGSGVHVDVIFSDGAMRGESGRQGLLDWLDRHHPSIPHLLTAPADVEPGSIPSSPTRRFIEKPYELADLARHLEMLLTETGVRTAGLGRQSDGA
jgi:DNA-binding NtrC family response regulator